MTDQDFTVGIEEEYLLVDLRTRDLIHVPPPTSIEVVKLFRAEGERGSAQETGKISNLPQEGREVRIGRVGRRTMPSCRDVHLGHTNAAERVAELIAGHLAGFIQFDESAGWWRSPMLGLLIQVADYNDTTRYLRSYHLLFLL